MSVVKRISNITRGIGDFRYVPNAPFLRCRKQGHHAIAVLPERILSDVGNASNSTDPIMRETFTTRREETSSLF